jgi:hypothetical protein
MISSCHRTGSGSRSRAGFMLLALLLAVPAAAQMPDLSQMNGRSLPAPDAAVGTATVRVMKQTFGNNAVGEDVTLVDGRGTTIGPRKTDDAGRASFDGLRVGETYRAIVVVAGERLESQPFTQPPSGGVRVILVSGLGAAAAGGKAPPATAPAPALPAVPAPAGSIALGVQSRVVIEQADEFVEVFVLSDLVNTTGGPVSLPAPLVFPLPAGALGAAVLEGTTAAALDGARIVVKGPLAAGSTPVQFGYRLPSDGGSVKVPQVFPVGGPMSTVIVRRGATTTIAVAGERGRRDANLEGRDYIVVSGGAVQAAAPIDVTVSGLPARSRWPVRIALTLAGLIVVAGLVFGRARADDDGAASVPARS